MHQNRRLATILRAAVGTRALALSLVVLPLLSETTLGLDRKVHMVSFNHSSGALNCPESEQPAATGKTSKRAPTEPGSGRVDDGKAREERRPAVCVVSAHAREFVAVQVNGSVGGLFTLTLTRRDKAPVGLPKSAATAIGLPSGAGSAAAPGASGTPEEAGEEPDLIQAFTNLTTAFADLQRLINSGSFGEYDNRRRDLESARQELIDALDGTPYDPVSVAKAIQKQATARTQPFVSGEQPKKEDRQGDKQSPKARPPKEGKAVAKKGALDEESAVVADTVDVDSIAARLKEIETFRNTTSESLVDLPPTDEELIDRDFTLVGEVKTADPRFAGGNRSFVVEVVERGTWPITVTSGFSFSGLTDASFSKRKVIDRPRSETQAEESHQEVVEEPRDKVLPEAALFVNILPFASRVRWLGFSFGAGITTGASGRLYAGVSVRAGNTVQFTLGAAGGKVKRLSESIDRKNVGDVDPQATRVDVYKTAFFGAVTFRVIP